MKDLDKAFEDGAEAMLALIRKNLSVIADEATKHGNNDFDKAKAATTLKAVLRNINTPTRPQAMQVEK